MNEAYVHAAYGLGGAMLALMLLGLGVAIFLPAIDRKSKRFFITYFSLLLVCILTFFIDLVIYDDPDKAWLERIIVFISYAFVAALVLDLTLFLLYICGKLRKGDPLFRVALILEGVFMILLCAAQFTKAFYQVTPDNQFYRGPLHFLLGVPLVVLMALDVICVVRRKKVLSKRNYSVFLTCLLSLTVALAIHVVVYFVELLDIALVCCAVAMFASIMAEHVEQLFRQQREIAVQNREIARQHASVAVLQMRPHFIYNTLTHIYCLCDQDPDRARQVTLDFTNYLRGNFKAIASAEMISFTEELAHTRAYLSVAAAQYEDMLIVDYDLPHTRFRVPPLTLQPLAENAVKYGMDPDAGPLRVLISTREVSEGSEIIVENTGADFKTAEENNEPHIALSNIRQRLKTMCGGELTIAPREGGGTIVKVTVPGGGGSGQ